MKQILTMTIAVFLTFTAIGMAAENGVISLRGANPLDKDSTAFDRRRQVTKDRGFQRDWKLQPPLVPHKIDKDQVTLQTNTCLNCHGADTYKKEGAPKASDSHYMMVDDKASDTLDMRRYSCNQCHVPQVDAPPLVKNTFGN